MRPLVVLAVSALTLTACKRETSEAVAEAKGAAADAKRAAADAKRAADTAAAQAKAQAQAAVNDTNAKVHEMAQSVQQNVNDAAAQAKAGVEKTGQKVQQGVNDATAQAKAGVNAAGQSIHEVGEGNVVTGKLAASSAAGVVVVAQGSAPTSIGADDQTRWVSKGGIGAREGVPVASNVRVTYIVRDGQKVATQVEQLP